MESPPQDPPTNDPFPSNARWRHLLQASFIGPLALLKTAIDTMQPDVASGKRCKVVVISGMSSVQVLGLRRSPSRLRGCCCRSPIT